MNEKVKITLSDYEGERWKYGDTGVLVHIFENKSDSGVRRRCIVRLDSNGKYQEMYLDILVYAGE